VLLPTFFHVTPIVVIHPDPAAIAELPTILVVVQALAQMGIMGDVHVLALVGLLKARAPQAAAITRIQPLGDQANGYAVGVITRAATVIKLFGTAD
jgi:hypothetical protein